LNTRGGNDENPPKGTKFMDSGGSRVLERRRKTLEGKAQEKRKLTGLIKDVAERDWPEKTK